MIGLAVVGPYQFRPLTADDLFLVRHWLAQPHVTEWWGDDADASIAEVAEAIDDPATEPFLVLLEGQPLAYLQAYNPHKEEGHPYQDQPSGTLGVDVTIGEPSLVGQGHGSAIIRQFCTMTFARGVRRLIIDPDPANARAIAAYAKAGFRHFDTRTSIYGSAHMMALDADDC